MAVRTQISLEGEAHRRAKARAADLGISLAEYIRRLVARDIDEPRSAGDVTRIFGLGDSGASDIARHKDDYVGDAVDVERGRETAAGRRDVVR